MAGKKGRRGWGRIRRLPSSKRFQASYMEPGPAGPDKVRYNAPDTFGSRLDAEAWLASERRLIELGAWTPPPVRAAQQMATSETVTQYADRWIAERKLSPRTRKEYESKLRLHIKPAPLGSVPIASLTAPMVRAWYAGLDKKYPTRNAHCYSLLHAVCETAVTPDELLAINPCAINGAMYAATQRKPVILSVGDLAALAEAIKPERLKVLILLKAWCGLRWGEVIELRRKDIDNDAEVVRVRRAASHRKGCHIGTLKQGKPHTVVIPPHIRADIKHHLDVFVAKDEEALLFPPARGGCHLNDRVFRDYLDPALTKIGQKTGDDGMRVHDLKHFAGTMASRVGNLRETMARLGHSTVKAALVYQGEVSGRDAEIAAALSELATNGAAKSPLGQS
jgi:integrase